MYIQVTTRCNMHCLHCGFACTETGEDMSLDVFTKAAELAGDIGEHISIGGGEPTTHPQFWAMIGIALGSTDELVWLAINGKETNTALKLARMARKGTISVRLSLDKWHEPIDQSVVDAFKEGKRDPSYGYQHEFDQRDITIDPYAVIPVGRAADLVEEDKDVGISNNCICSEIFITPNGDIFECGCLLNKIGTVWDGYEMPDIYTDIDFEIDEQCTKIRLHEEESMQRVESLVEPVLA